ncbi:hypothetical protein NQD34_004745, partial [Periophthalmus magnuspinnatus]
QELTLQQKNYVLRSEVLETQQEEEKMRRKYERKMEHLRDVMKEADVRSEEVKKTRAEFERRLVKPLKEKRLDLHEPEKVLQYIKDKSKVKMNQMEKCSLQIQSMRVYEKKLRQQLQQRKDLEKNDYKVKKTDLFLDVREEHHDQHLDEVLVNNIKTQHLLNSYKDKLQRATRELSNIEREIAEKEQKSLRLEERVRLAQDECFQAQILNERLRSQIAEYEAPDTTEYMLMKEKHRKLQQSILTWERRAGAAETALKTYGKSWTKPRATLTPVNSAETRAWSGGGRGSVKLPDIAEHKEITTNKNINM